MSVTPEFVKQDDEGRWLGLRVVLMDLMAGIEIKGDEAMIETLAEFSKGNTSHVKGILNLTIPLDESPMWILGQYLAQLGLSTESRRPLENGQRIRYYRLNTEDVEFAQKVLEYRQKQREQREQKRRQELERNAAYAARMRTQYGINLPLESKIANTRSKPLNYRFEAFHYG